jgi:hypothetical protein
MIKILRKILLTEKKVPITKVALIKLFEKGCKSAKENFDLRQSGNRTIVRTFDYKKLLTVYIFANDKNEFYITIERLEKEMVAELTEKEYNRLVSIYNDSATRVIELEEQRKKNETREAFYSFMNSEKI